MTVRNFDPEEFFKEGFDIGLRNFLESTIFHRASLSYATPFLATGKLTLRVRFDTGVVKYEVAGSQYPRTLEFNFEPSEYADITEISSAKIVEICKFTFDDKLTSFIDSFCFIDLSYLSIKKTSVFRDRLYDSLAFTDDFKNSFYVTVEFELFFLAKLLLPGSADFFLNSLRYRLATEFTILHVFEAHKLNFQHSKLINSNDLLEPVRLPWRSNNDWQNHFLHLYVAKKLIPVKDFVGTNELGVGAERCRHAYFELLDLRRSELTKDWRLINTKYVRDGMYIGLQRFTIEHEQDLFEVQRTEAVTGFCEPRYLVRGFYDDEPLSAEVLINLMRFYLYYTGTAFEITTTSTFSLLGFQDFVRARIMRDPKSLDPVVYEGGTVKGPFKICRLVPVIRMRPVLLEMVELVRNNLALAYPFLIRGYDLNRLIALHSDEALKLIMARPTDYVWCLEPLVI